MHAEAGQAAIRLRHFLQAGLAEEAAACVPLLDEPHRIEVLLGAALRDARNDYAAASAFLLAEAGRLDWGQVCARLVGEPDTRHDELAAAWVGARRVPEHWPRGGQPLPPAAAPRSIDEAADLLAAGVSGPALLEVCRPHRRHAALTRYYEGPIAALGVRPLLCCFLD